ncbi:MAG: MBG domain-containing protein [Clostridiales bacterium]|nr:MBG domain-containing protein [Clostridiales bacterium]
MKLLKKSLAALLAFCLLLALAPAAFAAEDFIAEGVMGNVSGTGAVNANDAAIILRSLVQLATLNKTQEILGDVNHDGRISAADAAQILRFLVQLEPYVEKVFAKTEGDYRFTAKDNQSTINEYLGTAADIVLPIAFESHRLTALGTDAFAGKSLRSVTFSAAPPAGLMFAGIAAGTVLYYPLAQKSAWVGQGFDPTYHVVCIEEKDVTFTVTPPVGAIYASGVTHPVAAVPSVPVTCEIRYNGSLTVPTNAGTYSYEITVTQPGYEAVGDNLTGSFTVGKATYDMSGVSFTGAEYNLTHAPGPKALAIAGSLPVGVEEEYIVTGTGEAFAPTTALGTHYITARFAGDAVNYYPIETMYATLTLLADGMHTVSFDVDVPEDAVYAPGLVHKVTADPSESIAFEVRHYKDSALVTDPINAGIYVYVVESLNPLYAAVGDNLSGQFTIAKATHNMGGITFTDAEHDLTVNPGLKKLEIGGTLPAGVTVKYYVGGEEFTGTSARGTYEVTAKFIYDEDNYNTIPDKTATLELYETVSFSNIVIPTDAVYAYNTPRAVTAVASPAVAFEILYDGSAIAPTDAGTYNFEIVVTEPDYRATGSNLTGSFTIGKATVSGITLSGETRTDYSGTQRLPIAGTLPADVRVTYYVGGAEWNGTATRGAYTVTARFAYDADNYNTIGDLTATLTLKQTINFTAPSNAVYAYNTPRPVTASQEGGYTIAYTKGGVAALPINAGAYTYVATITDEFLVAGTGQSGSFTINKATVTGISLTDEEKDTNPSAHGYGPHFLEIRGTLPADVTVRYEWKVGSTWVPFNGVSVTGPHADVKVYEIRAIFTYDANNYHPIMDPTVRPIPWTAKLTLQYWTKPV